MRYSRFGSGDWLISGGGLGAQNSWDVAVDRTGAAVLVGNFQSSATFGSNTLTRPTGDSYLARLDVDQRWIGAQAIGGTNSSAYWAGIDGRRNVFVGGSFLGFLRTGGGDLYDPNYNRFLIKYLPDGKIDWIVPNMDLLSVDERGNALGFTTIGTNKFLIKVPGQTYALFAQTIGKGSVGVAPAYSFYNPGDEVVLTASPARWYQFAHWSDGNTINPRVVIIGSNNTYTAIFAPIAPLETLTYGGVSRTAPLGMPAPFVNGAFIPTGGVTVLREARLTLQSSFTNGTIFYTLDGTQPSIGSRRYTNAVTIHASRILRAAAYSANQDQTWEMDPIEITVIPAFYVNDRTPGGGRVIVTPTNVLHISNTVVTVGIAASNGWTFLQWLGDVSGTIVSNRLEMTEDRCVQGVFGTRLTTSALTGGSVLVEPAATFYAYGTRLRLSAVPAPGHRFARWLGAVTGSNNPTYLFVGSANPVVQAQFTPLDPDQFSTTIISVGHGEAVYVENGDRIILIAAPYADEEFLGWGGDAENAAGLTITPVMLSRDRSRVITADFTRRPRLLTGPCASDWNDGAFRISLSGDFGERYQIDKASTGKDWSPLVTVTNVFGTIQVTDPTASAQRLYRARVVP